MSFVWQLTAEQSAQIPSLRLWPQIERCKQGFVAIIVRRCDLARQQLALHPGLQSGIDILRFDGIDRVIGTVLGRRDAGMLQMVCG